MTVETEELRFNTGISAMMEFVNAVYKWPNRPRAALEPFVLLLSPYAPHVAEELWSRLGHSTSLAYAQWPAVDESLLVQVSAVVRGVHAAVPGPELCGADRALTGPLASARSAAAAAAAAAGHGDHGGAGERQGARDHPAGAGRLAGRRRGGGQSELTWIRSAWGWGAPGCTARQWAHAAVSGASPHSQAVPNVAKLMEGKAVKKVIFVKGKILNLVVA